METFKTTQKTQTIIYTKQRKRLRYIQDSSRRNNFRIEDIEEEEEAADDENWDQCKEKVSSVLKSRLNVKLERAHGMPRRKRSHKVKPRTIVFKLDLFQDKENIMRNVYLQNDTGYYINEDFSEATLIIRAWLCDEVKCLRRKGFYGVIKYDRIFTNKRDEVVQE